MVSEKGKRIYGKKVILRAKELTDASNDYIWAIDRELTELDATEPYQFPLSVYLVDYPAGIQDLSKLQLSIETPDGVHIGNCTCYNIDTLHNEAELGIMIGDRDYWGKGYGADAVKTFMQFIFDELGMKRICIHTLDWNIRALKCFEKSGFTECGRIRRNEKEFISLS